MTTCAGAGCRAGVCDGLALALKSPTSHTPVPNAASDTAPIAAARRRCGRTGERPAVGRPAAGAAGGRIGTVWNENGAGVVPGSLPNTKAGTRFIQQLSDVAGGTAPSRRRALPVSLAGL